MNQCYDLEITENENKIDWLTDQQNIRIWLTKIINNSGGAF